MAKLLPNHQGTLLQADVIDIIHDKVVSLCQKKYSSVNFLEIDGLICISVLDTKEQQVVKIHKTLTSISGKPAKHKQSRKDGQSPLLEDLISSSGKGVEGAQNDPVVVSQNENHENYQDDINMLNELLKNTTDQIITDQLKKQSEGALKSARRKRKQSHPRAFQLDINNEATEPKKNKLSDNTDTDNINDQNVPGVNPFLHHEAAALLPSRDSSAEVDQYKDGVNLVLPVTVKSEPLDPDFGQMEETVPKISEVYSQQSEDNNEHSTNLTRPAKVSNIIDRLIEEDFHVKTDNEGSGTEQRGESSEMEVKVERTVDDSEYGVATSSNNDTADESEPGNIVTAKSIESLLGDQSSDQEAQYFASLMGLQPMDTSRANYEYLTRPNTRRRSRRTNQNVCEKTWMDRVKANVSKYQAALAKRSAESGTSEWPGQSSSAKLRDMIMNKHGLSESDNVAMVQPMGQGSAASSLLNLLQKPPLLHNRLDQMRNNDTERIGRSASFGGRDLERPVRSSSVPRNMVGSNITTERSCSCSPTPVVKIEVDDIEENYNSSGSAEARYTESSDVKNDISKLDNCGKLPGGKLESRYPALVNQLQFQKQEQTEKSAADDGESLVNRLPFISFQEIFSSAGAGGAGTPRMSESTTRQLLEQAKVKPTTYKPRSVKKSVWNWKKRVVRPKKDGEHILENLLTTQNNGESSDNSSKKFFGVNLPSRKTFARRNSKNKSDNDQEWKPSVDGGELGVNGNRVGRSTRLSLGSKPRINFAEVDTTDSEFDEETEEISDPPVEYVSAYCSKSCGKTFQSLADLQTHEEFCRGGNKEISSGAGPATSSSSSENYNCTLCGLDFNQEYRWHYHMIKVHGVTAEKIKFFR